MLSPRGARGVQRLNSTATLIQRTTTEAPQRTHVLHRTRCSQENDQLLRQGCERADSSRWQDRCNQTRTRHLDEDSPTALDGGDGSNDLHQLDQQNFSSLREPKCYSWTCSNKQTCEKAWTLPDLS